ncbi:MAG: hypothetical protein SGBAC_012377, partial [Bacillariaceae sp.]
MTDTNEGLPPTTSETVPSMDDENSIGDAVVGDLLSSIDDYDDDENGNDIAVVGDLLSSSASTSQSRISKIRVSRSSRHRSSASSSSKEGRRRSTHSSPLRHASPHRRSSPHRSTHRGRSSMTPDSKQSKEKVKQVEEGEPENQSYQRTTPGVQYVSSTDRRAERKASRKQEKSTSRLKITPGAQSVSNSSNLDESTRKSSKYRRSGQRDSKARRASRSRSFSSDGDDDDTLMKSSKHSDRRRHRNLAVLPGAQSMSSSSDRDITTRKASKFGQRDLAATPGARSASSADISRKDTKKGGKSQRKTSANPGAQSLTTSNTRGERKAARNNNSNSIPQSNEREISVPGILASDDDSGAMPTLAATAASNFAAELEAARQAGIEEGRNANRDEEMETDSSPKENNKDRKYKYMLIAFVVFAIAAGIITWLLVSADSSKNTVDESSAQIETFDPPTTEDCLAISEGRVTANQNGTTVRSFGVEMDVALASDVDLALLQNELEQGLQRDVLPLLVGCDIDVSVSLHGNSSVFESDASLSGEKNTFVVENALLNLVSIDEPASCNQVSEEVCSSIHLQLDLFSKDDDVPSEVLSDLVTDVFQEEGLVDRLNFISPVKGINYTTAFEILPSIVPTSNPSIQDNDIVPGDTGSQFQETCAAIRNGTAVVGQEDLSVQEYDILMDVMWNSEPDELSPLSMEVAEKIRLFLLPSLAGCTDQRRRLQLENYIVNAMVGAEASIGAACLPDSESPCHRYSIHLDIYVQSIASVFDFSEEIVTKFREAPLVDRFGLLSPFKRITIVEIIHEPSSTSPS